MLTRFLAAIAALLLSPPCNAQPISQTKAVAKEAVAQALTLPPGYRRDRVLRSVSRNLRWHGEIEAGTRAARAMTDGGVTEIPPGTVPGKPRFVPLREAMPSHSPCDLGLWRLDLGKSANTAAQREKWATECLLTRDFHWIGLPERELVTSAATGLPVGDTKAQVLALLVGSYRDPDSLRFVEAEFARDRAGYPAEAREGLAAMLAAPDVLYRLGRKDQAIAAGLITTTFTRKAAIIRALVADNDAPSALRIFETLPSTPPEFVDGCHSWFGSLGGLGLTQLGWSAKPVLGLGTFLDGLTTSPAFRRICPTGLDAEELIAHLLAAGRPSAAVARASLERAEPWLLVSAALQAGTASLRAGDQATARRYAMQAAEALPAFDPGDPLPRNEVETSPASGSAMTDSMTVIDVRASSEGSRRNFGEGGRTRFRFEVVQLLAASGAIGQADELARAQKPGSLRAVALSAAVAGRSGVRFDEQAPSLDTISADEV